MRQARQLPDQDQRAPADAAAGPRAAGQGEQDLRDRGAGPDPPAAQRDHHGAARSPTKRGAAARLPRRRHRPRQDLDAGARRRTRTAIVQAAALARPLLGLLDTYSPEFPCLLKGCGALRRDGSTTSSRAAASGRRMSFAATQRRALRRARTGRSTPTPGARSATGCPTRRCRTGDHRLRQRLGHGDRGGGNPLMARLPQHRDHGRRDQAGHLRAGQRDRHRHPDRDHGLLLLRQRDRVQGRSSPRASLIQKGDDVRVAGVRSGRSRRSRSRTATHAEITFKVKKDVADDDGDPGVDPLPQPRRRPLHVARAGASRAARGSPPGRTIPHRADHAGAEPDRAVQRLPAAVPGAAARRGQQPVAEPGQGAPGRGRHDRQPAEQHGVADQRAGRPRPAHRSRSSTTSPRCSRPSTTTTTSSARWSSSSRTG